MVAVGKEEQEVWFAMSATYARELKAKAFLESQHVECFVPMRTVENKKKSEDCQVKLEPAVHNLIFVHTTKTKIRQLKSDVTYLQYMVHTENGRNVPIIVPDDQMQQFITLCESQCRELIYLTPEQVDLAKGTCVRVVGGCLDGLEGIFVKIEGLRNRRFVLSIPNVTSVATAEVSDGVLEVVK